MDILANKLRALSFSADDYARMFALEDPFTPAPLLVVHAGLDSVVAERAQRGLPTVACDDLYRYTLPEVIQKGEQWDTLWQEDIEGKIMPLMLTEEQAERWYQQRLMNRSLFLQDYAKADRQTRYQAASLLSLPFAPQAFACALVSHWLFFHDDRLSLPYHMDAIEALLKVAPEVRIFPLLRASGSMSEWVGEVTAQLQVQGIGVELKVVPFQLQPEGNTMMRIWTDQCVL